MRKLGPGAQTLLFSKTRVEELWLVSLEVRMLVEKLWPILKQVLYKCNGVIQESVSSMLS